MEARKWVVKYDGCNEKERKPLSNLQTAQAKLTGDHIYCTNERERLPQIRIHRQKEAKKKKKLKQTHIEKL